MYGGAVSLARQFLEEKPGWQPDLILASGMLDLPAFLSLSRLKSQNIPVALYFHENQITYPWSPTDADPKLGRDNQYGFINYTSALTADGIYFNSDYHRNSFLESLPGFLRQFPDHQEVDLVETLIPKSEVLPLGMDLAALDVPPPGIRPEEPVILWNHRWEYDKGPDLFFETLFQLVALGQAFKLIVLGESFRNSPPVFKEAKERLKDHILHFGYAEDRRRYAEYLQLADILLVTSRQDFFGGSTVEAIYAGCYPLLPDRLAFPEHIPAASQRQHLYQNDVELLPCLLEILPNIDTLRHNSSYRDFVAHYDWRILAPHYDRRFEILLESLHP